MVRHIQSPFGFNATTGGWRRPSGASKGQSSISFNVTTGGWRPYPFPFVLSCSPGFNATTGGWRRTGPATARCTQSRFNATTGGWRLPVFQHDGMQKLVSMPLRGDGDGSYLYYSMDFVEFKLFICQRALQKKRIILSVGLQ